MSETLEKDLEALQMSVNFYSGNNFNECKPNEATEITVYDYSEGINFKSFKVPKNKFVDLDWILSKFNTEKTYQQFTENFKSLLKKAGFENSINVYPTSYGIGIFVVFSYRDQNNQIKAEINKLLDKYGIEYKNQRSDAGWVFRYVISKKKENIEKLPLINF